MSTVRLENISKRLNDQTEIIDLSFTLKAGEIFGFVCSDNETKKLLLRVMTGLIKKDYGHIYYFNQEIDHGDYEYLEDVGIFSQDVFFYEELSGYENIMLYLEAYRKKLNKMDILSLNARLNNYFKLFNLYANKDVPVSKCSEGMLQKLRLIRAFIIEPKVLLLDDPFLYLDPITAKILFRHLKKLASSGTAIFIATNLLEFMDHLVDRVAFLHDGRMVEQTDINDLMLYQQDYLEIKTDQVPNLMMLIEREMGIFDFEVMDDDTLKVLEHLDQTSDIIKLAYEHKIKVHSVRYGYMSLEEYFMNKIN